MNAQTSHVLIDKPTQYSGGGALQVDFGSGAQHVTVLAPVPGWQKLNTSGAQYVVLGA